MIWMNFTSCIQYRKKEVTPLDWSHTKTEQFVKRSTRILL